MIVGWQIATHMRTELVLDALEMAVFRRDVTGPLVHHSDAGSQFTAIRYSDRLTEAGIAASIGSIGDSYDKAMTSYCTPCLCRDGKPVPERNSLSFDEAGVAGLGRVEESDVLVVGLV